MPRKKAPKKAGRPKRKATKKAVKRTYPRRPMDRRVEDFAEEMGRLGERATRAASKRRLPKRLYRSGRDKILGGVCGGIAEHLNVDPVLIRLLWVMFALAWGVGILMYIIAWIIIPRNPRYKW